MSGAGCSETVLAKLRVELRKDDVKLWTEPYTNPDGTSGDQLKDLTLKYSASLKLTEDEVFLGLDHLRVHALNRLKQNAKYRLENMAAIRLKFSPKSPNTDQLTSLETRLDISGADFVTTLAAKLTVEPELLKLIYQGKIITLDSTLLSQGVQHNKTIMCMIFNADNKHQTQKAERQMEEVKKVRRGAELIASSSNKTAQSFDAQITDQNGRAIDLPDKEKSSLMVALGLHEKGREVLKKKNYSFALLFLLEADSEFRQCRSEILNLVDNFAVLCLDISWCYLCIENLDALPDVSQRLSTCEEFFKKSYGTSLQRLTTIKGSSGHEVALFVRLYVLQGIVAYHEGKYSASRDLLAKAQSYVSSVDVDEEKIVQLVGLGFTMKEARLALRSCEGNLVAAQRHAFEKRDERERILKDEKEKSRKRLLARELGNCADGKTIDIDLYEKMVNEMGFDKKMAAEALKKSNNKLYDAIDLINNNPEALIVKKKVTAQMIQEVTAVGFDADSSRAALTHFQGNHAQSIEYLLSHSGIVPPDWLQAIHSQIREHASTSKADHDAMKKLARAVDKDEDDYLDVTVDEEKEYISMYLAKIDSIMQD